MADEEERTRRWLAALEANAEWKRHPLMAEVKDLAERYIHLNRRIVKLSRISDRMQVQVKEANIALRRSSQTDPLTGLPNRRWMWDKLRAEANRAQRGSPAFTLLMGDVDGFKRLNDTWGHDVGDAALVAVARVLSGNLRDYDSVARWGGEEFLILLPETDLDHGLVAAEKLRGNVENLGFVHADAPIPITMSFGLARLDGAADVDAAIRAADQALYEAKRSGRNRCRCGGRTLT
ncbi:MAG: GGDEF domain-containing protein [Magnetospirillum sp. WYHS-4]